MTTDKRRIIIFEGPDSSGKTHIAQALSKQLQIPYFKNDGEHQLALKCETGLVTRYAGPYITSFLRQVPVSVIIDRHYPSEFVYAHVKRRPYDRTVLRQLDAAFASMDAKIILCVKTQYTDYDDANQYVKQSEISAIRDRYVEFLNWTDVSTLLLNTTSENLSEQLSIITDFVR
jgi:cytidylate kinase